MHPVSYTQRVEPLDWLLITSLPIDSLEQVLQVVDDYAARWTIEVYTDFAQAWLTFGPATHSQRSSV